MTLPTDIIDQQTAVTLPGLFRERVRRTPLACAYRRFDDQEQCCIDVTWKEVHDLAARWQEGLRREGLTPGDRVAVMMKSRLEWVLFDLAALGLGLVTVPIFVNDRAEDFAYILEQTDTRFLVVEHLEHWKRIMEVCHRLDSVERIVSLDQLVPPGSSDCTGRLTCLASWLPDTGEEYTVLPSAPDELATIVYTSGTTGLPKGVMLSHGNILADAHAGLQRIPIYPDDLFLSFLPLSHTFERTVGYYIPIMAGACVAHVRSIEMLPEDLLAIRPTVLSSVPRIYERIHKKISVALEEKPALTRNLFYLAVTVGWKRFLHRTGRGGWKLSFLLWPFLKMAVAHRMTDRLGGRVRIAISGGAALAPPIARVFLSLGLNLFQGYGLTETSPVISVNTMEDNLPATVGRPLPGVETKVTSSGELLVRGPTVMLGYWKNQPATQAAIDHDGWFHTGDLASIDAEGHISITGRLKEIIVLSTGEKIPPEDLEIAIAVNPLFDQVMVVGEGRPYLAALAVLTEQQWRKQAARLGVPPEAPEMLNSAPVEQFLLAEIARRLSRFPGYAQIMRVHAMLTPWGIEEGLITATLKLRRSELMKKFAREVESLYEGH
jgi:long-chain acyl-CoA synthetase